MKEINHLIKNNILFLIMFLPFLFNFLLNIFQSLEFSSTISSQNIINFFSTFFISVFFLCLFRFINKEFKINSNSLSAVYFFFSYFIFDSLFLPITKYLSFSNNFYLVTALWLILIISKKPKIQELLIILSSFFVSFFYNRFYFETLSDNSNYIELNSDVPLQWLDITSMIYENNYFYALDNNPIEGQGLLISYIQSIILKINFNTETFIFINNNYNIIFLISLLLIFDTNLTKKNKYIASTSFLIILFNNDWLYYLFANSLMLEGFVSLFFAIIIYYYFKNIESSNKISIFYFISFGTLVLSKNFISLIVILLIFYSFKFIKQNTYVVFSPIVYISYIIYQKIFFSELQNFAYTNEINFKELLFDLILIRNLKLDNITNIIQQFLIDKPTSLVVLIFLLTNLYIFINKRSLPRTINLIFFICLINYFLVNVLYISYWQNVEFESSYRYLMSCFHIIFLSNIVSLDEFEKAK